MNSPKKFEWTIIRRYRYWSLRVNTNQENNLGRSMVWLNRGGNMRSMTILTLPEQTELWGDIIPQYELVIEGMFHPDRYNYAWLGNLVGEHGGHGHVHLIPRYSHPVTFAGRQFIDPNPGGMYVSGGTTTDRDTVIKVRDAIAAKL